MATDRKTVDYTLDQIAGAGAISAKAMFGEYGLYCDGKMFAIIGDDQLFVKPTAGGRAFAPDAEEASPYPCAKACLLINAESWDEREWLSEMVRITAAELPAPNEKVRKKPEPA